MSRKKPHVPHVVHGLLASALLASTLAFPSTASADELPGTVYAAAYLGADDAAGTSLPAALSDGSVMHPVTWDIEDDVFDAAYSTVNVQGIVDGQPVAAHVEVIPPAQNPLVYFVDAGHGGDSQTQPWSRITTNSNAFSAVDTLAGASLRNDVPDQRYVEGGAWGFTHGTGSDNYKITLPGGDPNPNDLAALGRQDKFRLGVRTNGSSLTSRVTLDPGTYTLTTGYHEFYAAGQGRSRGIAPTLSYFDGAATQTRQLGTVQLTTPANGATDVMATDTFTIPDGATDVRLSWVKVSGEAPVFSWYAIAEGDAKGAIEGTEAPTPVTGTAVTIDAEDIASTNVNGLTFKGFGTLSANSTSSVLMDYKAQNPEKYDELLRTLFGGEHPLMQHVKIEMGTDRNNSTGSDPATMRWADEPANVLRHPGFQLAADASAYNPDLVVSVLRWVAPVWASKSEDATYAWYKNTILAAHRQYGFMVDYINPGVNEHAADLATTKAWYDRIHADTSGYVSADPALAGFRPGEAEQFHQIKLVISDEVGTGTFGAAMVADADLRDKVEVAAFHYNTDDDKAGNFKRLATEFDTQVWNSEAQATFSNSAFRPNNNVADPSVPGTGIGGTGSALEMANTVVKGFTNSHRTHFIYQPAIGSFYEGGQYSFKELVSARDPWSGWIHYDAGLAVLQHFSNFAVTGWENADNTAGIWRAVPEASMSTAAGTNPVNGRNGAPNYMTLAAPDRSDFSTVMVNDSETPRTYIVTPKNFGFDKSRTLAVWETRAADDGEQFNANYKQHREDLRADGRGAYTVVVKPFSIVTVTSLDVTDDAGWTTPLPVEGERPVLEVNPAEGVLWEDDFDYTGKTVPVLGSGGGYGDDTEGFIESRGGDTGFTPLYNWDRQGSFEGFRAADDEYVLRQQVDTSATGVPGAWNNSDPITGIGDRRWTNYEASVDVRFERTGVAGNYGVIGVRGRGTSGSGGLDTTPYALKLQEDGAWQFLRRGVVVANGSAAAAGWDGAVWHRLSVRAAGSHISGSIDGEEVFSYTDANPYLAGFVDLASGFHYTQFDNLRVEHVEGFLPHYGEHLDNLEMNDLAADPTPKLVYDGTWSHRNGLGMHEFQRSRSTSTTDGASVSYTFTGSGLDLIAGNGYAQATFDIHVDGDLLAANVSTQPTDWFQMSHSLRGLEWGRHTVRITQTSGSLDIDAVGVASTPALSPASAAPIVAPLAKARATQRSDAFTDDSWALLQRLISQAGRAVTNPAAYALDGEGVEQIVERLQRASNPELSRIISLQSPHLAAWQGEAPELPATVTATLDDGSTVEVDVDWNAVDVSGFADAWSVVDVQGTHGPLAVSARVEVVPRGTVAFGDVNASAAGGLGRNSPAWVAIDGLVGGLVNEEPDQVREGNATWGHWAQTAQGTKNIAPKGVVDGPYDKTTTTGISTANSVGAQVEYTFDLAAGDYTITAASHTWWPGNARSATASLLHDGTSTPLRSITLDSSNPTEVISGDVTLAEAGPVTFILKATNGQSPLLSWAAAVRHDAPATYSVTYDRNGGEGVVPAPRTGAAWTDGGFDADAGGLTRPGHTFEGWNTASDGSGVSVLATTTYAELVGGDVEQSTVTLHAQWKESGPTPEPSEEPSPEPSEEPSPEPSQEPSQAPSPEPTRGPTQVPTVTVTATPSVTPTSPGDVYSTPGFHAVNGRKWYTACEPYSQTIRCRTEIWATQIASVNGSFVTRNGWVFNNLTYLPLMTRAQWSANPLGHTASWTASDGRRWKTECDTVATGSNGCRSWAWTTFVASRQNSNGAWTHFQSQGWVFNNIVRFKR